MRVFVVVLGFLLLAPSVSALLPGEPVERGFLVFPLAAPLPVSLAGVRVLDRLDFVHALLVEAPRLDALAPTLGAKFYPEEVEHLDLAGSRREVHAEPLEGDLGAERGANATVAVVDSGLDLAHPAFEGRVETAVRFLASGGVADGSSDRDGHGTHVAGIVAGDGAMSENDRLHGIAPAAKLVVLDLSDSFTTTNAVRAFRWIHDHHAEYRIRVVQDSWGRERNDSHYDADDPVIRASDALAADGLLVVFSAGNRGADGRATLTVEATNPNVLAVGAVDAQGNVESYSSRGPALDASGKTLAWTKPDLVAPGTAILSTRTEVRAPSGSTGEEHYYVALNGTSMAAPHVSGAAALLFSAYPSLTAPQVAALLTSTAREVGAPGPDAASGYGLLDVRDALHAAAALDHSAGTREVDRRVPFSGSGHTVVAGTGFLGLGSGAPSGEVTSPFALPAGARSLSLDFAWTSSLVDFDVTLVAPDGSHVGPFSRTDSTERIHVESAASAGSWTLLASPRTGSAGDTDWSLSGSALVATSVPLTPASLPVRAPPADVGWPDDGARLPFAGDGGVASVVHVVAYAGLLALSSALVATTRTRKR